MQVAGSVDGSAGVASGHRLATEAGIEALRSGGSAVDAALAAAFTQWVVNAPQSGPGGEMVALVAGTGDRDGEAVQVYGGWSRSPLAPPAMAGRDSYTSANGGRGADRHWPGTSGPHNAVVPGSLRGAEAAWQAHGRLDWTELFSGAGAAAAGHVVTARMAEVYQRVQDRGHTEALQRMLGTGTAPGQGTTIRMPDLAATLETVAQRGPDAFYRGELADRLVAAAAEDGAALTHDDLHAVQAAVEPAWRFELDDIVVWVTPAPSQAAITAALLAAAPSGADPASRQYAEATAPLTEEQLTEFCRRGPTLPAGTAVATALDPHGLSATVVHSLAGVQFGTGWVADGTGVAFSNRVGTALSDRSDLPGCHRRGGAVLPHTLSAAHVRRRDGSGWMTLATPGGDRQVQWLAQAVQRFRRGAPVADIAAGPRWFVCPTGDRFGVPAGIGQPWYAFAEPGIEWRDDARLASYEVRPTGNVGGGLQVVVGPSGNSTSNRGRPAVELASDPRSGGAALTL